MMVFPVPFVSSPKSVSALPKIIIWQPSLKRTVTNVGDGAATYRAKVTEPKGSVLTMSPETLSFRYKNEKLRYNVLIKYSKYKKENISYGDLVWIDDGGTHTVRSPIVMAPSTMDPAQRAIMEKELALQKLQKEILEKEIDLLKGTKIEEKKEKFFVIFTGPRAGIYNHPQKGSERDIMKEFPNELAVQNFVKKTGTSNRIIYLKFYSSIPDWTDTTILPYHLVRIGPAATIGSLVEPEKLAQSNVMKLIQ
ncbi:hypothetical protein LR48_Vigan10g272800 [Vigna angularis]|uniref:Subtilisin-like protease fibronectin type-III domain-containing protein n=1 Tax=Phaseolus angularis TaxID=3914 RepID=A0A0L9VP40_PHAAN|nr:hypothetical protein LR48_Vigan10g272800 [Vigna angularis]